MTGIDLGKEFPIIRRITAPYLDDRGLWIDLDIAYGGGFSMSLETKVSYPRQCEALPVCSSPSV